MELAANSCMSLQKSSTAPSFFFSEKPLRLTGQSLREEIEKLTEEGLIPFFVFIVTFWIVVAVEWTQKLAGGVPDPRFWTFLSLIVTGYGAFKVFRLGPKIRSLRFGARSERKVAEILDRIRSKGFVAFHDLPGTGSSNVDHVVVGPSGIYAIETKARIGSGTISYGNDNELIFGGRINDGRSLRQARGSAQAVLSQLKNQLGWHCRVKPVLVLCGNWRVTQSSGDFAVDVMTAQHLESYFERQQPELTSKEIAHICSHLERSARN